MTDKHVSNFEKKLKKLNWKTMLMIQVFIAVIISASTLIQLQNIIGQAIDSQAFLTEFIISFSAGIVFLFGGYYFTKLFFTTKLSVTQFYTTLIYLYLPIITMVALLSIAITGITLISSSAIEYTFILYLPILYYAFKELNTSIYIFKKEFSTTDWPLVLVVLLWAFITNLITIGIKYLL